MDAVWVGNTDNS